MEPDKFIFDDDLAPYMSGRTTDESGAPEGFDEDGYLKAHPEVVEALANKQIPSALFHYRVYGQKSAVMAPAPPVEAPPAPDARPSANNIDTLFCSHSGAVFVVG